MIRSGIYVKKFGEKGFVRTSFDQPAPAVMADGIGGACRRGWQYFIVGAGMMPSNVIPKEGSTVIEEKVPS